MEPLLAIVLLTVLGGVLSVVAAGAFLLLPEARRVALLPALVSFAIGTLLGAAFLALLPHALEGAPDPHAITGTVLIGVMVFFLLEKMVLWRHSHDHHGDAACREHEHQPAGALILVGDGIHNLLDGVLIASALLVDVRLGVLTSLAVVAHEIPQEVSDFAILLHSGFSTTKAFVANLLVSLTTVIGGVVAYFFLQSTMAALPYVLAIAAASFIYVAVADLIPSLHKRTGAYAIVAQTSLILAGIGLIALAESGLH